jgi:thiol-disulfide isomerase/thioredoxin
MPKALLKLAHPRCLSPQDPVRALGVPRLLGWGRTVLLLALVGPACSRRVSETKTDADGPGAPTSGVKNQADTRTLQPDEVRKLGSQLGSKGFLLNVWASWCGPCKDEFPMLVRLEQQYAALGVPILFVSVDSPESREKAVLFARSQGLRSTVYFADGALSELKRAIHPGWAGMLPASFLFDHTGNLRYFWGGPAYENELSPIVSALARGENVQGEKLLDDAARLREP